MSKQEYLKRYLEDNKKTDRKKSKHSKPSNSRLKILVENIDIKSIKFGGDDENNDEEEEAPVVVEVIDERPIEVKVKELYGSMRWKKLGQNNENSVNDSSNTNDTRTEIRNISKSDKDSDSSPPRKQSSKFKATKNSKIENETVLQSHQKASNHKTRHNSDNDHSPPRSRNNKHKSSNDNVSHNRNISGTLRHDSDSDISPPRVVKNVHKHSDYDEKALRTSEKEFKRIMKLKERNENSNSTNQFNSDSDLSPERNNNENSVFRESTRNSPIRNNSDSDVSHPNPHLIKTVKPSAKDEKKRPMKTLSGLKAGLQNASTLQRETKELREREKIQINQMHETFSGKNADTIIRDRETGLKRNIDEEMRLKKEEMKKTAEHQQKYTEWGKGVEQLESKKSKLSEDLYEMSKPLARYCDDEDLEERLKSIIYDDDPMAEYVRKKKKKHTTNFPTYSGPPPPPNRFGIPPGYRWDGVDRSNGFEKKYFERLSSTKAVEEEAHLWSVQNM